MATKTKRVKNPEYAEAKSNLIKAVSEKENEEEAHQKTKQSLRQLYTQQDRLIEMIFKVEEKEAKQADLVSDLNSEVEKAKANLEETPEFLIED